MAGILVDTLLTVLAWLFWSQRFPPGANTRCMGGLALAGFLGVVPLIQLTVLVPPAVAWATYTHMWRRILNKNSENFEPIMPKNAPVDTTNKIRMPLPHRWSLGVHIRLWMLAVGFLPLVVLFVFGYLIARNAVIEASDDHLLSVVDTRQTQIESWLQERLTDLEVISRSRDCHDLLEQAQLLGNHGEICSYLDTFQTGARDYQSLILYDHEWKRVASSTNAATHQEPLVDKELRRLLSTAREPVITAVHHHQQLAPGLHLGARLRRGDGSNLGFVVASINLTGTFAPILQDRAGLGKSGVAYLTDMSGRILLPDLESIAHRDSSVHSSILERVPSQRIGTSHFRDSRGKEVFAGFYTIPERGWILVAEMDESEALGLLRSLRQGFLIAGLLTLLAVIILSSRISLRLSNPLDELAAAAHRIEHGRRQERVPELAGREVAEVGYAFNRMLDALEETQRQKIQANTLAAIGELSSGVVHEMRNRLSSVKMNVQALKKQVESDATNAELGQIALDQLHRVEQLLNELLNYARPEALEREEVRVESLLKSMKNQFKAEADVRNISLHVDTGMGTESVFVDQKRLEDALGNLLRNAFDAVSPGGHVTLRTVPHAQKDGLCVLEIEDDGAGFEGISQENLFLPFFTTKDQGTGLGLAHSRKIVELHGGKIEALTGRSGGALLRLELPLRRKPIHE